MKILYYLSTIALAIYLLMSSALVSDGEAALSRFETPEAKTDTLVKGWMETLSFGLYTGASEKAQERKKLALMAGYHRERVTMTSAGIFSLSLAFMAWLYWRSNRQRKVQLQADKREFALHLHGVAAICLFVGLATPMLTIIAQREVAVIGNVILQFETKSIIGTVRDLFANGSLFVAALLGLFSIVVPMAKLVVSMIALGTRSGHVHDSCMRFLYAIGKWSMTDVFVVAILLAFLASKSSELTDARLGPGLYFFAAYGLLTLFGSSLLSKVVITESLSLPEPSIETKPSGPRSK